MLRDIRKRIEVFVTNNFLPTLVMTLFMAAATISLTTFFTADNNYHESLYDEEQTLYNLELRFNELESGYLQYLIYPEENDIDHLSYALNAFEVVFVEFYSKVRDHGLLEMNTKGQFGRVGFEEIEQEIFRSLGVLSDYVSANGRVSMEAIVPVLKVSTQEQVLDELKRMRKVFPDLSHLFLTRYQFMKQEQYRGTFIRHNIQGVSMGLMGLAGFCLILLLLFKIRSLEHFIYERQLAKKELDTRLAAMEASMDGIGVIDHCGQIVYMNKALMELCGIGVNEYNDYKGRSWMLLHGTDEKHQIEETVLPELESYGRWCGERMLLRRDGQKILAEMSLTSMIDGGMVVTARDMTARRRAEDERERLQEQFNQSQKMEALGRMAGGIAHDFNNILGALQGYVEFLLEDMPKDSKEYNFARQIMHGVLQAEKLVDQVLAFSRRNTASRHPVNLNYIVYESLEMVQASLTEGVDFQIDITVDDAIISGNETQIQQSLMNLCVNARDALNGERGTVTVSLESLNKENFPYADMYITDIPDPYEVSTLRVDNSYDEIEEASVLKIGQIEDGRDYVVLSVEDTGCGISRQVMAHIFEAFFTTKASTKGTGLGLASVLGIVAGHKGAVTVMSVPGEGSRFSLYFPLSKSLPEREVLSADIEELKRQCQGKQVLLVEDQEQVRQMLEQMLTRLGFVVESYESAQKALQVLREDHGYYDLVLTDQSMPHMTGLELGEEIGKEFPGLPVILISGFSQTDIEGERVEIPSIRAVLKKPISSHQLLRELANVLQEGKTPFISLDVVQDAPEKGGRVA